MKKNTLLIVDNEIDEMEWLKAAATNPVFDFLNDFEKDGYSLEDGKPFSNQDLKHHLIHLRKIAGK